MSIGLRALKLTAPKTVVVALLLNLLYAPFVEAHCGCDHGVDSFAANAGFTAGAVAALPSGIAFNDVEDQSYISYATTVLDNLILHGTDRYGVTQSNDVLVSSLDVTTKNNPSASNTGAPRTSNLGTADELWRAENPLRRSPGGSNLLHNQEVFTAMKKLSVASGNASYSTFVDNNLNWGLNNLVDRPLDYSTDPAFIDPKLWWGYHRWYNVHEEGDLVFDFERDDPVHEVHYTEVPRWNDMWTQDSTAVQAHIQGIWDYHIQNQSTGDHNRHDRTNNSAGYSFATSGAAFIEAFAFMASKTNGATQTTWLNRAKLIANYHWASRNGTTGLMPHTADSSRWDGDRSATTTPGVYVPALMKAFEYSGDTLFRDQAITLLKDWADEHYDATSGSYWGSVTLSGNPVLGPWAGGGYEQFEPRGLVDMWAPEAITAQYNTDAAQTYAKAYQQFGDAEFLTNAQRWAELIRLNPPKSGTIDGTWYQEYSTNWSPLGTYAEHYAHAMDLFMTLFETTGEDHYLLSARDTAKDALSTLWYDGLLRGHAGKQYYEAFDGVGLLLEELVDLNDYEGNFTKFGDFDNDGDVDDDDFNNYLRPNMGTNVSIYAAGDVDGDRKVTMLDFDRFKYVYYEGTAPLSLGIPEPSTLLLILTAIPTWIGCRRRQLTVRE